VELGVRPHAQVGDGAPLDLVEADLG